MQLQQYVWRRGDRLDDVTTLLRTTPDFVRSLNAPSIEQGEPAVGTVLALPKAPRVGALTLHRHLARMNGRLLGALPDDPLWMPVALREEQADIDEWKVGANPRIVEYLQSLKGGRYSYDAQSDETAWCAAFVNWCYVAARVKTDPTRFSVRAVDWADFGVSVQAKRGALAVYERGTSSGPSFSRKGGHVGFIISMRSDAYELLGGNQSNSVSRQWYPLHGKKGVDHYRCIAVRSPA